MPVAFRTFKKPSEKKNPTDKRENNHRNRQTKVGKILKGRKQLIE
jgi:hypothetical protein